MLGKKVEQRGEERKPGLLVGREAGNMTSQLKTDSIKEVCQQYVVLDMKKPVQRGLKGHGLITKDENFQRCHCTNRSFSGM